MHERESTQEDEWQDNTSNRRKSIAYMESGSGSKEWQSDSTQAMRCRVRDTMEVIKGCRIEKA